MGCCRDIEVNNVVDINRIPLFEVGRKETFNKNFSDLNLYQAQALSTAIYNKERGVEYTILGLAGEAGEVAGKLSKIIRDQNGVLTDADRVAMKKELGDVLWFVATAAHELGFNLIDVAQGNLDKLASRKERNVLQGSGDDR